MLYNLFNRWSYFQSAINIFNNRYTLKCIDFFISSDITEDTLLKKIYIEFEKELNPTSYINLLIIQQIMLGHLWLWNQILELMIDVLLNVYIVGSDYL